MVDIIETWFTASGIWVLPSNEVYSNDDPGWSLTSLGQVQIWVHKDIHINEVKVILFTFVQGQHRFLEFKTGSSPKPLCQHELP